MFTSLPTPFFIPFPYFSIPIPTSTGNLPSPIRPPFAYTWVIKKVCASPHGAVRCGAVWPGRCLIKETEPALEKTCQKKKLGPELLIGVVHGKGLSFSCVFDRLGQLMFQGWSARPRIGAEKKLHQSPFLDNIPVFRPRGTYIPPPFSPPFNPPSLPPIPYHTHQNE